MARRIGKSYSMWRVYEKTDRYPADVTERLRQIAEAEGLDDLAGMFEAEDEAEGPNRWGSDKQQVELLMEFRKTAPTTEVDYVFGIMRKYVVPKSRGKSTAAHKKRA